MHEWNKVQVAYLEMYNMLQFLLEQQDSFTT